MEIRDYSVYRQDEILSLYESVGWRNYTAHPEMLETAYRKSLCALAAYEGNALIGILRAVGDGASILYIQDIIVHPDHQHQGVGTALVQEVLRRYPNVYQTVLMTDDTEKTVQFYQSLGFRDVCDMGCTGLMKMRV